MKSYMRILALIALILLPVFGGMMLGRTMLGPVIVGVLVSIAPWAILGLVLLIVFLVVRFIRR